TEAIRNIVSDIHLSKDLFALGVVRKLQLTGNTGVAQDADSCAQVAELRTRGWLVEVDGCP
ncbi:MAG: hypothetical protein JRH20_23355, partial [Deltaproteobacteria bacterium]|nr:hypothetical protein [Deltaproteobacteria bacterium]